MICDIIRGIACIGRMMDKARKNSDEKGFACDDMPCFKNRDDDDEKEEEE